MSEQNSDNSKQENSGGLWARLRRPSGKSLGGLLAVGFVVGVLFWGGFNTALEATNTEKFCISCHEMYDNVYMEYKETIHYNNRTGVRATCPDCHVPKDWTHKMIRKVQASKELWGKMVGTIDTRECRNCHSFESMNKDSQKQRARKQHEMALEDNMTCIDCHKGIAHHKPEGMTEEDEE